jgi:hypothetical protein
MTSAPWARSRRSDKTVICCGASARGRLRIGSRLMSSKALSGTGGVQAEDNPQVTAWEFSILNGVRTVDGGDEPHNIGVLTGPRKITERGRAKARATTPLVQGHAVASLESHGCDLANAAVSDQRSHTQC